MPLRRVILSLLCSLLIAVPLLANPTQITFDPSDDRFPSWSPDGSTLYFQSNRNGPEQIYKVSTTGGAVTRLTFIGNGDGFPKVSPDGTKIAFMREGSSRHVYTMNADGSMQTDMTSGSNLDTWSPEWTRDGLEIWFGMDSSNWGIHKIPATGGPIVPVVASNSESALSPIFSDDGLWVAFSDLGNPAVEAPMSDPTNYTSLTSLPSSPLDYSADGTKILMATRGNTPDLELHEYNRATSQLTQITFDGLTTSSDPGCWGAYSPDGTKVAYSSRRNGGSYNIWILELQPDPQPGNTLTVGDESGLPGTRVVVPVTMNNETALSALEFKLTDAPDRLSIESISVAGAAGDMTVSHVETGGVLHTILFSAEGNDMGASISTILNVEFRIANNVNLGESIDLTLSDVVAADALGNSVAMDLEPGQVRIERKAGDINGDNTVDVGDLVILIEIILGKTNPSSAEEDAADCNGDEIINALDVPCVLSLILNGPSSTAGTTNFAWNILGHTDVKGLQVHSRGKLAYDGLELGLHSGRAASGENVLLAFSETGAGTVGDLGVLRGTDESVEVRAFGSRGESLPVRFAGSRIEIGVAPSTLSLLPASPNPLLSKTQIRFDATVPGVVSVAVFDVRGALVTAALDHSVVVGRNEFTWSAIGATGKPLGAGIYFIRLSQGDQVATTRVVVMGN